MAPTPAPTAAPTPAPTPAPVNDPTLPPDPGTASPPPPESTPNFNADDTPPVGTVTLPRLLIAPTVPVRVRIDFNEPVFGFGLDDLSSPVGRFSDLSVAQPSGTGEFYTATFTAAAGITDATSVIALSGDYRDAAGNPGESTVSAAFRIDGVAPTAVLSLSTSSVSSSAPGTLTVRFSELVSGFDLTDLTASNATLSNLSTPQFQNDGSVLYTVRVSPPSTGGTGSSGSQSGSVSFVPSGIFDAAGNALASPVQPVAFTVNVGGGGAPPPDQPFNVVAVQGSNVLRIVGYDANSPVVLRLQASQGLVRATFEHRGDSITFSHLGTRVIETPAGNFRLDLQGLAGADTLGLLVDAATTGLSLSGTLNAGSDTLRLFIEDTSPGTNADRGLAFVSTLQAPEASDRILVQMQSDGDRLVLSGSSGGGQFELVEYYQGQTRPVVDASVFSGQPLIAVIGQEAAPTFPNSGATP